MSETTDWLEGVEEDLRAKVDRTDALDDLFQISFAGEPEEVERTSWCLAKMAQNKVQDMRVFSILMSMRGVSDTVSENVCWGLGELAGIGIGSPEGLEYVTEMMDSPCESLRGMAAWSAGRMMHRMDIRDPRTDSKLLELTEDESPLVSMSARFATEPE